MVTLTSAILYRVKLNTYVSDMAALKGYSKDTQVYSKTEGLICYQKNGQIES